MKGHVYVPVEGIHTKLWLWRQWSQQGLSGSHLLLSRNEFVHSQQCTKPTWLLLQHFKPPLTGYTGLQQHKGNYFLCMYFGLDTAWIYWRDGTQTPGNISDKGWQAWGAGPREQCRPAMSVLSLPSRRSPGPLQGLGTPNCTAQHHMETWGQDPHTFPDLPWFIMTVWKSHWWALIPKAANHRSAATPQLVLLWEEQGNLIPPQVIHGVQSFLRSLGA